MLLKFDHNAPCSHRAERLSVSHGLCRQNSETLYTLLSTTSTCSSPRWQRSKTQTTCRSSNSPAVANTSPAGKESSNWSTMLVLLCFYKDRMVNSLTAGYLAAGRLPCRSGGRGNRTTGRTAWCCYAHPEGGPQTWDLLSSPQGKMLRPQLFAC